MAHVSQVLPCLHLICLSNLMSTVRLNVRLKSWLEVYPADWFDRHDVSETGGQHYNRTLDSEHFFNAFEPDLTERADVVYGVASLQILNILTWWLKPTSPIFIRMRSCHWKSRNALSFIILLLKMIFLFTFGMKNASKQIYLLKRCQSSLRNFNGDYRSYRLRWTCS